LRSRDEKGRATKVLAKDAKAGGGRRGASQHLSKFRAEDIGVEAVDDYTIRISLSQSAPYTLKGLLANPLFRLVA